MLTAAAKSFADEKVLELRGAKIHVRLQTPQEDSAGSDVDEDEEFADADTDTADDGVTSDNSPPSSQSAGSSSTDRIGRTHSIFSSQSLKTLLVSNLLDVDEQTIYFWIKSLLNVWPHSIQISVDEENAIVKIPADCHIGKSKS